MLRSVVLLVLVACGGGSKDPHAPGTCDMGWVQNGFEECELACEVSSTALLASGPSCDAVTIEDNTVSCSKTFVFEGVQGCCSVADTVVHFAECR